MERTRSDFHDSTNTFFNFVNKCKNKKTNKQQNVMIQLNFQDGKPTDQLEIDWALQAVMSFLYGSEWLTDDVCLE